MITLTRGLEGSHRKPYAVCLSLVGNYIKQHGVLSLLFSLKMILHILNNRLCYLLFNLKSLTSSHWVGTGKYAYALCTSTLQCFHAINKYMTGRLLGTVCLHSTKWWQFSRCRVTVIPCWENMKFLLNLGLKKLQLLVLQHFECHFEC